jgi:putative inorganic carbon (hco3(-)) transporter
MSTNSLDKQLAETKTAFVLYMVFMLSFFLRIPNRLPILGMLRLDLLLVVFIFITIIKLKTDQYAEAKIAKYIKLLFASAVISLPFVTWPGTAIGQGIPNLIKATIFFFFTYKLVINEQRLKIMVYLFLLANTYRILEPLVLHFATGYWGARTFYDGGKVDRLSGGPYDIIGPNGLAFVIATVIPFYHYLFGTSSFKYKLIYWLLLPAFLFTMALTLSRSGILAIAIIYAVVFVKSKRKFTLAVVAIAGGLAFFSSLNEVQKDRYLSIFSSDAKSSATAQGRTDGWITYYEVGMRKPIFGHGLGSSKEANYHFSGRAQPAHNLWLEIFQELGIVGLIVFIFYTKEIYKGFKLTNAKMREHHEASDFLKSCVPAMQVWLAMNFLFSFASYGLTSYEWYLFGGFSAVMARLAVGNIAEQK